MIAKLAIQIHDGASPRKDETPDAFLRRVHEGDARVEALLALDEPEPGPDFDRRFFDRLAALRIIERTEAQEVEELASAPEAGGPALDTLLAADAPEPSGAFDFHFRARLRGEVFTDVSLRRGPDSPLRVPGLPPAEYAPDQRLRSAGPRRPVRVSVLIAAAAAFVAGFLWFTEPDAPVEAGDPPDEELGMVAHLELLENFDEVAALEALEDDDTFELVASLDRLEASTDGEDDDDPIPGEVKTQ